MTGRAGIAEPRGLVLAYTTFNGAGAVLYLNGLDPRQPAQRRRRRLVAVLAAALLPVGVFGVLASKGGIDPIDHTLGDEGVRTTIPATNLFGRGRGDGRF